MIANNSQQGTLKKIQNKKIQNKNKNIQSHCQALIQLHQLTDKYQDLNFKKENFLMGAQ